MTLFFQTAVSASPYGHYLQGKLVHVQDGTLKHSEYNKLMLNGSSKNLLNGKVIHAQDGDTITILQDKKRYKIRFANIDCMPKPRKEVKNG